MYYIDSLIISSIKEFLKENSNISNFSLTRGMSSTNTGDPKKYIRIEIDDLMIKLVHTENCTKEYEYQVTSVEGNVIFNTNLEDLFSEIIGSKQILEDRIDDYDIFVENFLNNIKHCKSCPCFDCENDDCAKDICSDCIMEKYDTGCAKRLKQYEANLFKSDLNKYRIASQASIALDIDKNSYLSKLIISLLEEMEEN